MPIGLKYTTTRLQLLNISHRRNVCEVGDLILFGDHSSKGVGKLFGRVLGNIFHPAQPVVRVFLIQASLRGAQVGLLQVSGQLHEISPVTIHRLPRLDASFSLLEHRGLLQPVIPASFSAVIIFYRQMNRRYGCINCYLGSPAAQHSRNTIEPT